VNLLRVNFPETGIIDWRISAEGAHISKFSTIMPILDKDDRAGVCIAV